MTCQPCKTEDQSTTVEAPAFVFTPAANLSETEQEVVATLAIPGAGEEDVEIILEKGILTVHAAVRTTRPEGLRALREEYETGDYHRSFSLSREIDQDGIEASVNNGILNLRLPKREEARPRKIVPTKN